MSKFRMCVPALAGVLIVTGLAAVPSGRAHDIYTGIFNFQGVNCCGGHDCVRAVDPKDFEPLTNGYRVKSTGEFVPMHTTGFSPDANWHICRRPDASRSIRCLLVPPGGV